MRWTEFFLHLIVSLGTGIFIAYKQGDGGAQGLTFKYTGENFHLIRLIAGSGQFTLAGTAPVEKGLDVLLAKRKLGWAAVNNHANTTAVAFSPGAYAK